MDIYTIDYDIAEGNPYKPLYALLNGYKYRHHALDSFWFIAKNYTTYTDVLDHLKQSLSTGDKLIVSKYKVGSKVSGMSPTITWLNDKVAL